MRNDVCSAFDASRRRTEAAMRCGLARAGGMLACLAILVAAGCGPGPQRRYYTLSYPLLSDRVTESRPPIHPVKVRIRPFHVALPYDRPQMVYRQSPYEFNYDPYRLWASKPQQMLRELVEQHLVASRLLGEITREFGDSPPAYELGAEVMAVEEYDAGDAWYGHLAMRFDLVRFADQKVIWHYEFDRKRRVHEQRSVYIVRALSEILRDEMLVVTAELDRVISQERGVAATLTMPPPAQDDSLPSKAPEALEAPGRAAPVPSPAALPGPRSAPVAPAAVDDLIVP